MRRRDGKPWFDRYQEPGEQDVAGREPLRKRPHPERIAPAEADRIALGVRAAVEAGGFDVIATRVFGDRRLRLMVEGAGGKAVTLGDCERASRALEGGLRALGLDPGSFEIEVESPGADRPLTRDADFERFKDQQVTVALKEARDGRRNFTGRLIGRSGAGVTVHVLDEADPTTFAAPDVREVRLHPEVKPRPVEPEGRRGHRKR